MTFNEAITFAISPGLQTEIDHLSNEHDIVYDSMEKLKEATKDSLYQTTVHALLSRLHSQSRVYRIIDLGCGFGETSLLLAAAGHEVHSIDPAANRCKALSKSLASLKLAGSVYLCTAEDLDKISLQNLDGALFYSSLHHCDHPLQALKHTKASLGSNGVIVINEPILKFYRSKEWYNKQLEENPIKMGHYGGNEHIYYFKEYYNMLKEAGFVRIEFHLAQENVDPRKILTSDLNIIIRGKPRHSVLRCLVKYLVYSCIQRMSKNTWLNKIFIRPLLKMSLLQACFIGHVS